MTRLFYILLLCMTASAVIAAEAPGNYRIPEAFPEGNTRSQRPVTTADEAPAAILPGAPEAGADNLVVLPPPPNNADWLIKRMAESDGAALRKRASEVWPVTDAFKEDMDAFGHALVDPDAAVRAAAADRIKRLEPAQVFGYVMSVMVGGALERVRALDAALPALQATLTPFMLETLRTEIETPLHRRIAAYCLGRMGALNAVETLGEYAWSDDYVLSRACVDALYAIGTVQTMPQWITLLEHHDLYCRQLAARACGALGGPEIFERLRPIILDAEDELTVQSEALRALGDHPPAMLYPLLVDVLSENRRLRPIALRMLREYAGVDFGWDMNAWREWLRMFMTGPPPPPIVPGR